MTIRFAKVLKMLGAEIFLYGHSQNDAPCDELIPVILEGERAALIGQTPYQAVKLAPEEPLFTLTNPRIAVEIGKRKQRGDLICTIGGASQEAATTPHPDLMVVEYSIGYVGCFSPYRIYQSHAWRHVSYGYQHIATGRFFDDVIPGFCEVEPFQDRYTPGHDYLCYVGRLTKLKGIGVACDAARLTGLPLKIVGHGDPSLITYGEFLGGLPDAQRNEVMGGALALLAPTLYLEPYGFISPEAQLAGTPVISTDWGGFVETVEHGLTGYRCTMLGEFTDAISKVGTLDRCYIRQRARALYSMETAALAYGRFFARLGTLWEKGWPTVPWPLA